VTPNTALAVRRDEQPEPRLGGRGWARELGSRRAIATQELGHLLKTFVATEVMKQLSWMDDTAGIGHLRTHDGTEVDLAIEGRDGSVVAIDVKAGSRDTTEDLTGLRAIRDALGDAFLTGAVDHVTPRPPGRRVVAAQRRPR
jgi:uncharacterized protein